MGSGKRCELACTVLIPAHNEEETIRAVFEGTLEHVDRVLVISDGSTDGTVAALAGLPVEIVDHTENRGKGYRLAEGLDHAIANGAEAVLTLDADDQHDPDDIPAFIAAATEATMFWHRFRLGASTRGSLVAHTPKVKVLGLVDVGAASFVARALAIVNLLYD